MRFKTLAAFAVVVAVLALLLSGTKPAVRLFHEAPSVTQPTGAPPTDESLQQAYIELKSERDALKAAYAQLKEEHDALRLQHEELKTQYERLLRDSSVQNTGSMQMNFSEYDRLRWKYDNLTNYYNLLKAQFDNLLAAYDMLNPNYTYISPEDEALLRNPQLMLEVLKRYRFAVEGQMVYWKAPTLGELKAWLEQDDTSEKKYFGSFGCWEFAIMLKIRAKMVGWNMGLVFIEGYRIDDPSKIVDNSTKPPIGEYFYAFHAVNGIILADGRVAYIEPQNDKVFFDIAEYARQTFGENFVILRTISNICSP